MNEKMLKYIAAFLLGIVAGTIFNTPTWALDWSDVRIWLPTGAIMAEAVSPLSTYSKVFNLNTSSVSFKSCQIYDYYKTGRCDYLYKCYAIMSPDCSSVDCMKAKGCTEILTLQNPEVVAVSYTPSTDEVGKKYGVAVFILKSQMTYDWSTKSWSDYTIMEESTKQADIIEVSAPVQPVAPNPMEKISLLISNIINIIKGMICQVLKVC